MINFANNGEAPAPSLAKGKAIISYDGARGFYGYALRTTKLAPK
jgi:hypothetical protein